MKLIKHIFVGCCMIYTASCGVMHLSSCSNPAPVPPPRPPTPPAPVVVGHYKIIEFDANGNVKRAYTDVSAYKERSFPRSVTFDYNGQIVTLSASYEIDQEK